MRGTWALIRASWLTASSYRLALVMSIAALLTSVVPLYFVANALQPVMADTIAGQGSQYFGFVIVGIAVMGFLPVTVRTLPTAFSGGINTGTLEALVGTPTRLPALVVGMTGYEFLWTVLRALIVLAGAALLGAEFALGGAAQTVLVLALTMLAYVPIGLLGAAMVLVFRTPGPLPAIANLSATFLGGVFYPTSVIPSWLEHVSAVVPLTYGLRALRRALLEGAPLSASRSDILVLVGMDVVLLAIGVSALVAAMRHARRSGSLSQY